MPVLTRTLLAFSLIVGLGALQSGLTAWSLRSLSRHVELAVTPGPIVQVRAARAAWDRFDETREYVASMMEGIRYRDSSKMIGEFSERIQRVDAQLTSLKETAKPGQAGELAEQLTAKVAAWTECALVLLGERPAASIPAPHVMARRENEIKETLQTLVSLAMQEAHAERVAANALAARTETSSYLLAALTLILGLVLAANFSLSLTRPLKLLELRMRRLAGGDLDTPIGGQERRDETGSMARALEVFRQNAAHLKETRTLLESVFNHAREQIFIIRLNEHGQFYVAMCNAAASEAHALPPEQMTGKTAYDLIGKKEADAVTADLRRAVESRLPVEAEYHDEKSGRDFECIHCPLLDANGTVDGICSSILDITERKRIDRMKSEFIATVSHELRTPLTSIAGALGLIIAGAAGEAGDKLTRLLNIAHGNCTRLVRLVNDILDIEKIEAGRMAFKIELIDLRAAAQTSLNGIAPLAQTQGVALALEHNGGAALVNADEDRLAQVITNLVSNAVKFSPRGETVTVTLSAGSRSGFVRMTVSDHGPGIPPEFQSRLFNKFSQADNTDTRAKGGTGLGLCICKEIVKSLGGEISFDTAKGAGSNFHVELPSATEAACGNAAQTGQKPRDAAPAAAPKYAKQA